MPRDRVEVHGPRQEQHRQRRVSERAGETPEPAYAAVLAGRRKERQPPVVVGGAIGGHERQPVA